MRSLGLVLSMFISLSVFSFAGDVATNAEHFGILTLLPPAIAIILAFVTKNVILSLFIGVYSGTFLLGMERGGVFGGLVGGFTDIITRIINSMADSWNAGIILKRRIPALP